MTSSLFTILAMPKPFQGHIDVIQRNAIRSWTKLPPKPPIFLFGEERGTTEIAAELQLNNLRGIQRNEFGTPLLNDLLLRARQVANTALLCYVNSDIILLPEFQRAVAAIYEQIPRFLAVTHRWEINLFTELDFSQPPGLHLGLLPPGVPGNHTAIDVFVFSRDMYLDVPPLALGRAWFDQWLIKDAVLRGIPVIDITSVARAIHQNHEYTHIAGGQRGAYGGAEASHNLAIYGGVQHAYTLLNATHELLPDCSIRSIRYRREKFLVQQWFWRNFVQRTSSLRQRLGLKRSGTRNRLD